MRCKLLCIICALPFISLAQQDSTILYKNKRGETTIKDSAYLYDLITKNGDLWHAKVYYAKNNVLQSEGDYTDKDVTIPTGRFDNYLEDGKLFTTCNYNNGKLTDKTYYYNSGEKQGYISYSDGKITEQKGWDKSGNEIPGYIVEQGARFSSNWNVYLERHLKANVAAKSGLPAGLYEVVVSFNISKDGSVVNVKVESFTGGCDACAEEAVRVFSASPAWQPAIQNNKPVIYRQKQKIVFKVEDSKRNKN